METNVIGSRGPMIILGSKVDIVGMMSETPISLRASVSVGVAGSSVCKIMGPGPKLVRIGML